MSCIKLIGPRGRFFHLHVGGGVSAIHLALWIFVTAIVGSQPAWSAQFTIGTNFTGVTLQEEIDELGEGAFAPPDTMGSVGPNHIAEFINGAFAVYNKDGSQVGSTISDAAFWSNAGIAANDLADPRILYDPTSSRWFAAEITIDSDPDNTILVARSETSDPSGAWGAVSFGANPGTFADFPTLGLDADGVYIGTNDFDPGLSSVSLYSIPKTDLLAATPVLTNMTRFDSLNPSTVGFTLQPVVDFGPSKGRTPIIAVDIDSFSRIDRSTLTGTDAAGATLSATTDISVATTPFPPKASQPDGTTQIDTNDESFSGNVVQVGDLIYMAHVISSTNVSFAGRAAIRWRILRESDNAVVQEGTISDPNFDFFFPSIAANANGDVVIGYSRSGDGPNDFIGSFASVGQTTGGVLAFDAPVELKAGLANYHLFGDDDERWGDYSATVVDPSNTNVFWTFQEFAVSNNRWGTQITQLFILQDSQNSIWNGDLLVGAQGDGTSWADANNWTTDGVADIAPSDAAPGKDVSFPIGSTPGIINLGADRVVNSIRFEDDYTLSGNTLTVTSGDVDVDGGVTATINSNLAGANGLAKTGAGTLVVNGTAGNAAVEEGTLAGAGALSDITVATGATVRASITSSGNMTATSITWGSGTFALRAVERRTAGLALIVPETDERGGDYSVTVTTDSTGTPNTVPQPGDHVGAGNFVVSVNTSGGLSADLFQAVSGDTNGDKKIDITDIIGGILAANSFINGSGFDWTQGDFNGDTLVTQTDILSILATNLFGKGSYAANPTDPGTPADGVADLIIHTDGTATLDTNGLAINGFILRSLGDNFTAAATLPFAFFQTNTEDEASVGFATPPVTGLVELGQLYKPGSLPIRFSDLDFTYTVANTAGLFDGNCIGCVPEPSTFVLAAFALVVLVGWRWRWRR